MAPSAAAGRLVRCWKAEQLADAPWPGQRSAAVATLAIAGDRSSVQLVRAHELRKDYQLGGLWAGLGSGAVRARGGRSRRRPDRPSGGRRVVQPSAPARCWVWSGRAGAGSRRSAGSVLRLVEPTAGRVWLGGP